MNLTSYDFMVIIGLVTAIIFVNVFATSAGLTSDEVAENDIPSLSIGTTSFDFVGDMPSRPSSPSSAIIAINPDDSQVADSPAELGEGADGVPVFLSSTHDVDAGPCSGPHLDVALRNGTGGGTIEDRGHLCEIGDSASVSFNGFEVDGEKLSESPVVNANATGEIEYVIRAQPSGGTAFWERLPLVGGVLSAGADIAGVVGWIGQVLMWGIASFFELVVNVLGLILDVSVFAISLTLWMATTYVDVTANANGFASLVVLLPAIGIFLQMGKMVLIVIAASNWL